MKISLQYLVVSVGLALGFTPNTLACSCLPSKTVVGAYQDSAIVAVVSLQGTDKVGQIGDGKEVFPILQHRMLVEKIYKGNLTQGQEIAISEGNEGACGKSFRREEVGQKFLVFMGDPRLNGKASGATKELVFGVSVCSRSQRVEWAKGDLEYLDNMAALVGKTRLSGRLSSNPDAAFNVRGIQITISDSNIKRTATTDDEGFFEFWDLPAGKYQIGYALPDGWKIKFARSRTDADYTEAVNQVVMFPRAIPR